MPRLFTGVRAPLTLGTFLRGFRFGHVRQLDAVAARFVAGLAHRSPLVTAGPVTYVDIDDTMRATFGSAKQGAGYGYTGVKGLNALIGTMSTGSSAPVIVATRLRRGFANSARGAGPARRQRVTHHRWMWGDRDGGAPRRPRLSGARRIRGRRHG